MPRFGLDLDEDLNYQFKKLFFDHGLRTAILRRCVQRLVKRAKDHGDVSKQDISEIADSVFEDVGKDNL